MAHERICLLVQRVQETQAPSLGREDPWRGKWQPASVFLPGKFHGQGSLAGYGPWGCKESDWLRDWACERVRAHTYTHTHTHTHTHTEDTCGPPEDCFQQCEDWSRAETVMPRARAEVVPKKERQEAHTWVLTLPFTGVLIHSASVHVGC